MEYVQKWQTKIETFDIKHTTHLFVSQCIIKCRFSFIIWRFVFDIYLIFI